MTNRVLHPLVNPSFEGDGNGEWTRKTHSGQEYGEVFVPRGWTFFYRRGKDVPWDPSNDRGFFRPEAKVIHYEPPFVDPPRIVHGEWGFQFFGFYKVVDAGLYQTFATRPHDLLRVRASVHAWTSQDDDPRTSNKAAGDQAMFWIGMQQGSDPDPWGGDVTWSGPWSIYDQFEQIRGPLIRATGDAMTVFIRAGNRYPFRHNDFYIDNMDVVIERAVHDCEPREGFNVKRMLVLPPKSPDGNRISREMWRKGGEWAREHDLMDYGNSPDSACHAPGVASVGYYLGQIAPGYPDPEEYRQFNAEYYPNCELLGTVKLYEEPEPDPEPDPEPNPEPDPEPGPGGTGTLGDLTLGFHAHHYSDDHEVFIRRAQGKNPPGVIKSLSPRMLAELSYRLRAEHRPHVLRVLRHVANDDHGWLEGDRRQKARDWLDIYSSKLDACASDLARTGDYGVHNLADLLNLLGRPVVESVNECIGTYAADTSKTVEFDVHLMDAVEERYGDQVRAGVLIAAIGNPAMDELDRLLPAVKRACEADPRHLIAHHHAYWGTRPYRESYTETVSGAERVPRQLINPPWYWFLGDNGVWEHRTGTAPDPSEIKPLQITYSNGLERHWPWLAGRAMVWDDYFRTRHGLYMEHYAGEGGALTTPGDCGPGVLGGRGGWREAGSWDYVMPQLRHFNTRWQVWNKRFNRRFYGLAYFTHHWWGWDTHWVLGGEHLDWMAAIA